MGPIEASIRERAINARRNLERKPFVVVWTEELPKPKPRKPPAPVYPPKEGYRPIVRSISSMVEVDDGPFKWRHIVDEVCAKHNMSFEQLCGDSRKAPIIAARHEAFYRLSVELGMSLPKIGRRLGGKDHSTVLHGIRKHKLRYIDNVGE